MVIPTNFLARFWLNLCTNWASNLLSLKVGCTNVAPQHFGKKQEVSNCDSSGISHYTRNHDPISLLRLLLLWNWSLRSSQAPWSTLAAETTSGTFQVTISVSEAGNRMARPNIAHHIESNQPKVTTTNEDPAYIGMALNWHTSEVFNLANHGNLCFMAQNLASSCWEARFPVR